ncbi:MAG: tRNA (N(6)-L-threonylcarbamoyladenosine(37)-C(2))-methylthiotransferase MtaB [Bacteroidia bacterium]
MSAQKVSFYTLGCKLNFSETSTIARSFRDAGYQRVELDEQPDAVVINTCSVTENADKKCRSLVNRIMRDTPDAFIAIIGCYAQLKPQEIAEIPGVDLVLGASEKFNLVSYIQKNKQEAEARVLACEIEHVHEFSPSYSADDRTRTFFKVQDGCDYSCSFCTIPLARGKSRSASIENTVNQAIQLCTAQDVKEIVLTGVNTGDFGRYNGESFFGLIKKLDARVPVERFRISSIEPNLLSDEIIEFVAQSKKFVPHFHIPLQSGCDKTLKRMRRRYLSDLYKSRVESIKKFMPSACIGVDVIVGFPGETDEEFRETFDFIHSLDVSYLHVFTYSERENTHAISLGDVVPAHVRAIRSKQLHQLSDKKKRAFYESQTGIPNTVLWEAERDGDYMYGFTANYVKVKTLYNPELINQTQEIIPLHVEADGICTCINGPSTELSRNNIHVSNN